MKMIVKHSIKNIIRMPFRSIICFLIVFITVVVSVVCAHLYKVTEFAREQFMINYPAVATVSVHQFVTPEGFQASSGKRLNLDHVMTLIRSDSVEAYNISLYAGVLGEDEFMGTLPNDTIFTSQPSSIISSDGKTTVTAVNNLLLTEPFYSGDSVIIAGDLFDEADMRGGLRKIIISKQTAEKYGVSVGDKLTLKYKEGTRYTLYHIVGVYESNRGLTCAYIPLEDYFRDTSAFQPHKAYLDNTPDRLDSVFRLDFLLRSSDLADEFINDAIDNGFDVSNYDISINDKPYKTILAGLEDITSISLVILISVIVVGCAVFVLVAFFFSVSRRQERSILRALGMKKTHIRAMLGCELAIIMLVASILGVGLGTVFSDVVVEFTQGASLNETVSQANSKYLASDASEERRLTLHRYVDFSLTEGYVGLTGYVNSVRNISHTGKTQVRYETLWIKDNRFTVVGVSSFNAGGFINSSSYERTICAETHRMASYTFCCYVPKGSSYKVGDVIPIFAQDPNGSAYLTRKGDKYIYNNNVNFDVLLLVVGEYDSELYSDIVIPMKELELLCDYMSVSGNTYQRIRFDSARGGMEND